MVARRDFALKHVIGKRCPVIKGCVSKLISGRELECFLEEKDLDGQLSQAQSDFLATFSFRWKTKLLQ